MPRSTPCTKSNPVILWPVRLLKAKSTETPVILNNLAHEAQPFTLKYDEKYSPYILVFLEESCNLWYPVIVGKHM